MKKTIILWMLLFLCLLTGCGRAPLLQTIESEQKVAIRLATNDREDSIGYQQLQDFARLVQERSDNTIVVKIYGAGEWSSPESFLEYLTLGTLEMACLEPTTAMQLQPAYELYQQPYLFASLQEIETYLCGEEGKKALQILPKAYHGVGFVPDGYLYYLADGENSQWVSYGVLKQKGQTKNLETAQVYDLKAIYNLQPLVAQSSWWDTLTEEQQGWIVESFQEAVKTSLAQQEDKDPAQTLLASGVVFQENTSAEWNRYYTSAMNQRETYFSGHRDVLTAYWRPVVAQQPATEEEDVIQ